MGLFVRDPATAVLPGIGCSHHGTNSAGKVPRSALKLFLTSPGIAIFCAVYKVNSTAVRVAHILSAETKHKGEKEQTHMIFEVET